MFVKFELSSKFEVFVAKRDPRLTWRAEGCGKVLHAYTVLELPIRREICQYGSISENGRWGLCRCDSRNVEDESYVRQRART